MIKCFYHSADYDGILSGFLIKHFRPEAQLYPIDYGNKFPFEDITKEDTVYMVDFSLQPFENMNKLYELCGNLIWVDHHISAIKAYDEEKKYEIDGIRNNLYAGCELTWMWFNQRIIAFIPEIVRLIGRYDVWDDKASNWDRIMAFQYGLRLRNLTAEDKRWLDYLYMTSDGKQYPESVIESTVQEGKICLQYIQSDNQRYLASYGYEIQFEGLKAIVCNKGMSNSKLFDSAWDATKYDIMITYCKLKNDTKKWTISLYSTKSEIDCSIIAKNISLKYGEGSGGGHKLAAGCQIIDINFLMPCEKI